ncbi:unnamed protein product [Closterium sp. Naga37s-1]|nr:unnamed protein product [Closterium sp. Naga37s-1]
MLQVYGSYRQAFDLLTTFLLSLTHYACICMRVCRFPTLMQVGAPTHILLPPTFCSHPHSAPSIPSASVYDSYRQAFDMLTAFPEIKTLEDNVKFTQMLTMVRAAVLIMGQPIAGTPHSIVDMLTAFPEIKTLEDNVKFTQMLTMVPGGRSLAAAGVLARGIYPCVSQLVDDHTCILGVLARGLVDDHTPLLGVLARGERECSPLGWHTYTQPPSTPLHHTNHHPNPLFCVSAGGRPYASPRGAGAGGEGVLHLSCHICTHPSPPLSTPPCMYLSWWDDHNASPWGAGAGVLFLGGEGGEGGEGDAVLSLRPLVGRELDLDPFLDNILKCSLQPLVGRELDLDTFLDNMRELDLDQGVLSLRPLVGRELDLDPFLDNMLRLRINRRVIAEHHITCISSSPFAP